jgi:hypothetical protein
MTATQTPFTLQNDFSKLKMTGEAATLPLYIDLAIFDLMADGRKRSINEVVSALAVLGYMRKDVNRRMVVMLHKSKTFVEAAGGKGKVLYEIKKGATRPDSFATTKPQHVVKESDIVLEPQARLIPVTHRKRRHIDLQEFTMQPHTTPSQTPAPLFTTTEPEPTPVELARQDVAAEIARVELEATHVNPNDPVRVGLWKVMADHAWYKSTDLVTLLADFYPSDIVRYHLRQMVKTNMVEVDESSAQTHKYRLNEGVAMPEGLEPYKPKASTTPAPQPQLPLNQEPEMKTNIEMPAKAYLKSPPAPLASPLEEKPMIDTSSNQAAEPFNQFKNPDEPQQPATTLLDLVQASTKDKPKDVPLVEVGGINVLGQRFSYREARELLAELKTEGYGTVHGVVGHRAGKHITVRWSVTIGTVQVTPHQANDIALSLIDELE